MVYKITNYTYRKARKIGVAVKPPTNKTKKIYVFKKGEKVATIGALVMNDFPTYMQKKGLKFAKTRRRLYKKRHEKDRHAKFSNGWFADQLLW